MSDEQIPPKPLSPEEEMAAKRPDVPPVATIILTYNLMTGESTFEGPIGNKTICYGMLEVAKKQIDAHVSAAERKASQSVIQKLLGVNNGGKVFRPR